MITGRKPIVFMLCIKKKQQRILFINFIHADTDHECEAIWPSPKTLHHHERRGGAGLWWHRQVRLNKCACNSSCCVLFEHQGFPFQGLEFPLILNVGVCCGVGAVFITLHHFLLHCKVCWFFGGIFFFKFKCVWITDVLQSLHCKSLLLFPPDTSSHCHPCLSFLTLSPHSSMTCIHPSPCFPGLSFCTLCLFFPVGSGLMFFPLWFCILSLSLVSRQWFYPMVGDIMLFYHRVEPRTGCWRVSASIRQSIPTSFHKPQNRRVWLWWWSSWCWCWWAINHPNMHLFVCFVDYIPPCVHIPYFCVVLINLTFG